MLHIPTHHNTVNEGGGETEGVDGIETREGEKEREEGGGAYGGKQSGGFNGK